MVDASLLYPGVRVRIIDSWDEIPRNEWWHNSSGLMDKWLGQIVTIQKCPDADTRNNFYRIDRNNFYRIEEDQEDRPGGGGWSWRIDGFAEIIDDPWDFEPDDDIVDFLGLCGFCDPDHLFIEEVSDAE